MSEAQNNESSSGGNGKLPFTKKNFPVEYKHWKNMRRKCYSPTYKGYYLYGGKGVTVCDRWWDFAKFAEDVGLRPTPRHAIILKPGSKDFGPGRAKWMTPEEVFQLGVQGKLGPDDSNLEAAPGEPGPSGPSSIEDFSPKRVSYIHIFIGKKCMDCGGQLWHHAAHGPPDSNGYITVNCFECNREFLWKRVDYFKSI